MMFCWANIGQMVFYLAHRLVLPHMQEQDVRDVYISADGAPPICLDAYHRMEIYRSPHEISLIDLSGNTFFDSLNRKMMQSLKGESEKEKVTKWEKKNDTPQSWN